MQPSLHGRCMWTEFALIGHKPTKLCRIFSSYCAIPADLQMSASRDEYCMSFGKHTSSLRKGSLFRPRSVFAHKPPRYELYRTTRFKWSIHQCQLQTSLFASFACKKITRSVSSVPTFLIMENKRGKPFKYLLSPTLWKLNLRVYRPETLCEACYSVLLSGFFLEVFERNIYDPPKTSVGHAAMLKWDTKKNVVKKAFLLLLTERQSDEIVFIDKDQWTALSWVQVLQIAVPSLCTFTQIYFAPNRCSIIVCPPMLLGVLDKTKNFTLEFIVVCCFVPCWESVSWPGLVCHNDCVGLCTHAELCCMSCVFPSIELKSALLHWLIQRTVEHGGF